MGIFSPDNQPKKISGRQLVTTFKQKIRSEFKLAKEMMDFYDMFYGIDEERVAKINENFNLHSGRWPELDHINTGTIFSVGNENFALDNGKLVHLPVIDTVTKNIVADIISTPLTPTVKDKSAKGRTYKDRVVIEKLQGYFNNKYIQPKIAELQSRYLAQLGVQDPNMLPPEEIQKMQQTVDEQMKQETPEEIMEIFNKTRTPEEIISQIVIDDAIESQDVKNKTDIGGEYAVVTAEEYYKLGIDRNEPTIEPLNPKYVVWIGSEHTEYSEDGVMAKYEQYLAPEDVIQKYGDKLVRANVKTLEKYFTTIPGYSGKTVTEDKGGRQYLDSFSANMAETVGKDPYLSNLNFDTSGGQEALKELYKSASNISREGQGIRECYITWKWQRPMKEIKRVVDGIKKTFIRDSHYEFNPLAGDIEEREIIAPQVWHGTILGNPADAFYVNVEPVPFQYNNPDNPFDVKLTIYGGKYNTFQNNAKNVSFIDLGKPWNFKLNLKAKKMEEDEANNLGTLLHTTAASKPIGWSWAEWYTSMRQSKVIVSSSHFEGANQNDLNAIRAIQLSNVQDQANDIKMMEFWEERIFSAMYYNKAKLGQLGQYTTNVNAQMANSGAEKQMARFHNKHRIIVLRALTRFLNNALIAYRDNEQKKSILFDDFSKAYIENILDPFPIGQMSLYLTNDFEEKAKVEQLRQLALSMLQNGGSIVDIAQIYSVNSIAGIQDILERSERKRQKEAEVNHQREIQKLQEQQKANEALAEQQYQRESVEKEKDRLNKVDLATVTSMQMANANDINRDGVNDSLDRDIINNEIKRQKIEADKQLAKDKLTLEKEKAKQDQLKAQRDYEIAMEDLRIKEIAAKRPVGK